MPQITICFLIMDDRIRAIIEAAGGTVTTKHCCQQDWCDCRNYDHQCSEATFEGQSMDLNGSGLGSPTETEFDYVDLTRLDATSIWIKRVRPTGKPSGSFDYLVVVEDVQEEITAWFEHRRRNSEAGGYNSPTDDFLCQCGHDPTAVPKAEQLLVWQQADRERRDEEMRQARTGTCQWCKCEATDLASRRDPDEGMSGLTYLVCGRCQRQLDHSIEAELNYYDDLGY